ncbi:excinuclease ABC subunit UvrC [Anaerolineales bacterium HSG24]|nr:excinuclease ABC subunit UvrC [Anaerolineales bacterium HSG24]
MVTEKIQQLLKNIPTNPGVYLHKNAEDTIIYIGKAINLRNRVRSYFHKSASESSPKTRRLVSEIANIEFIITGSELEALLLENTLIKKHKPRYNIRLKDDKRYPYIKVHWQKNYPNVTVTRSFRNDGARYYGPYTASWAAYQTLDLIRKIFPYLTCTRSINGQDERACLYYHIGRCAGPCIGTVDKTQYRAIIDQLCAFLGGEIKPIVDDLERRMMAASEMMDYEKAAQLRDQIRAIDRVVEKQKVVSNDTVDKDVIAFAQADGDACVQVFFIRGGRMVGRDYFILENSHDEDKEEIMASFLKQFYDQATTIPPEIVLPKDVDELMIIRDWLKSKRGADVLLEVPNQGEQKDLLEMATQNAAETLTYMQAQWAADTNKQTAALSELQQSLDLPDPPNRIECYDISTLQGTNTVGSMVVFAKGAPRKSDYRRFKIKEVEGQDDFASMQEMLRRRFARAKQIPKEPAKSTPAQAEKENSWQILPDLVVIDGGKGQLSAALEVLDEFDLRDSVPIVGLAKREEELFLPGRSEPLMLSRDSQGLKLLQRARDEAHRFGVTYHRKLRSKAALRSGLDDIPGIGPKRRQALLLKFGSVKKIRTASVEALASVKGMNRKVAEQVKANL